MTTGVSENALKFQQLVSEVIDTSKSESERTASAKELWGHAIDIRRSIRPRGKLLSAANSLIARPDVDPNDTGSFKFLKKLERAEVVKGTKLHSNWLMALGHWGDGISASIILDHLESALLEMPQNEGLLSAAIAALGTVGGPSAIMGLTEVATAVNNRGLKHSACHNLEDLATGGTIDTSDPTTIPTPDLLLDVFLNLDWTRFFNFWQKINSQQGAKRLESVIKNWHALVRSLHERSKATADD